jgi:predicted nucleotidyltransferase
MSVPSSIPRDTLRRSAPIETGGIESMSALSRQVVENLRDRFSDHLVAVALFGSAARGEAGERSDLDFLVVLRGIPKNLERRCQV